jgi:hypothetical protein
MNFLRLFSDFEFGIAKKKSLALLLFLYAIGNVLLPTGR